MTTAAAADRIRAAPESTVPISMAVWAAAGMEVPRDSYTPVNTGRTRENSTNRITRSITAIMAG